MKTLNQYLRDNAIRQHKFAEAVGVTQGTISKLCGPRPTISPDVAARIEKETGGAVPVTVWPQFAAFKDLDSLSRNTEVSE